MLGFNFPRSRPIWLVLAAVTIVLGLGSRKLDHLLPPFLADNAGDAIWALMVFFGWGILFPKLSTWRIAMLAVGFAYLIEFSQLVQWQWLNHLRENSLAALVLGKGFLWVDLVRYVVGVAVGIAFEKSLFAKSKSVE